MRIEVSILSGYYEKHYGYLPFWGSIIKSLLHFLCYKTKFVHWGGYYRDRKTYEVHPRWWWEKFQNWNMEPRAEYSKAPAMRISNENAEFRKKTHFDMCNQSVEIPLTIRNLERSGKINTPDRVAWAKSMIEKSKQTNRIDYQKHGHPNLDKEFKHPEYEKIDD